jgi:hypothetical protein
MGKYSYAVFVADGRVSDGFQMVHPISERLPSRVCKVKGIRDKGETG